METLYFEHGTQLPSPEDTQGDKACDCSSTSEKDGRKRKREAAVEVVEFEKRQKTSSPEPERLAQTLTVEAEDSAQNRGVRGKADAAQTDSTHLQDNPIAHWATTGSWPQKFLDGKALDMDQGNNEFEAEAVIGRGRKRTNSGKSTTASTPTGSESTRSAYAKTYQSPNYEILLETKGIYMRDSAQGLDDKSKEMLQLLLTTKQTPPTHTLFDDKVFAYTCAAVAGRNEARVQRDITPLLVPSPEILNGYTLGKDDELSLLIETINEGWSNFIPITLPRPQPDFSVGLRREAFSEEQYDRFAEHIGDFLFGVKTLFMATNRMYLPFLTCEVKCGEQALTVAQRQNAHSAAMAARAVVELFRRGRSEKEVDRQILAFSVSHDDSRFKITAHYAVITEAKVTYYQHLVHNKVFSSESEVGDRWASYRFVRNIYDIWVPMHLKRLRGVMDRLMSVADYKQLRMMRPPIRSEMPGPPVQPEQSTT